MRLLLKMLLMVLLISSFTITTLAQESLYNKLNSQLATHYRNGRYSEAISVAKQALEVAEKTFGKNHPYVSASMNNLALLYTRKGNYKEAELLYERSLKIVEDIRGKYDPHLIPMLKGIITCYKKLGMAEKAAEYKKRLDDLQ
jgi:tetratricopeptide (TPR) repeat protein